MAHEVFISYKAEEYDQADWVRTNLERNGITCWMAPESIPGGSNYALEITKALEACRCLVLILSPRVQTSIWVEKEIEMAFGYGKTVFPFMIEKCELVGSFPFYLRNVQHYSAYQDKDAALKSLIEDVYKTKGFAVYAPKITPQKAPETPPQEKKRGGWLGVVIGLVLAAAIIALAVSLFGSPLLGIDSPAASDGTTTQGAGTADTTTTDAGAADGTTTSSTAQDSGMVTVVGEASLSAKLDVTQLSQDLTNLSRDTAAVIPFDALVGCVLDENEAHWYTFTTTEVVVHRIAILRVENMDGYFSVEAILYNEKGIKQSSTEFHNNSYVDYEYMDVVLEPNTKYYIKMKGTNFPTAAYAGYGLFVEPKDSDTGLSQEDATEIVVGEQYEFVLNSLQEDWLVFKCEEGGTYAIQLHNVDVGENIQLTCVAEGASRQLCTVRAGVEDSGTDTIRVDEGATVYIKVGVQYFITDSPDGTYIVEITKLN